MSDFQVGVVEDTTLTLKPETFLFNHHGIDWPQNFRLIETLFPATGKGPTSLHVRWEKFLDTLNAIQTSLQNDFNSGGIESLRAEIRRQEKRPDLDDDIEFAVTN